MQGLRAGRSQSSICSTLRMASPVWGFPEQFESIQYVSAAVPRWSSPENWSSSFTVPPWERLQALGWLSLFAGREFRRFGYWKVDWRHGSKRATQSLQL